MADRNLLQGDQAAHENKDFCRNVWKHRPNTDLDSIDRKYTTPQDLLHICGESGESVSENDENAHQ